MLSKPFLEPCSVLPYLDGREPCYERKADFHSYSVSFQKYLGLSAPVSLSNFFYSPNLSLIMREIEIFKTFCPHFGDDSFRMNLKLSQFNAVSHHLHLLFQIAQSNSLEFYGLSSTLARQAVLQTMRLLIMFLQKVNNSYLSLSFSNLMI